MNVIMNEKEKAIYNSGNVATAIDMETYKPLKVQKVNGKMCRVVSTSKPYTKVNPFINDSSDLNLTAAETKIAMEKGSVEVYRSSGAKDGDTTLTRKQQREQGCARVISVVASLLEGHKGDKPTDFEWLIIKDNSNNYEPLE